ncbi:hypothetical protein Hanom_Chr13g01240621 [Helianthus anomalus]
MSEESAVDDSRQELHMGDETESQNFDQDKESQALEVRPETNCPKFSTLEPSLEKIVNLENSNGAEGNQEDLKRGNNFYSFVFVNKEREGKLRKFKRLKTRQRKQSKSPQAHTRKSKRPRNDDPFDLSRLLGINSTDETSLPYSNPKEFITPDLNVSRNEPLSNENESLLNEVNYTQEEDYMGMRHEVEYGGN